MLLSTLTSAAGASVSRGERDVGALVGTLTECPLGSICAHVITTSIARLLVKCGVISTLCLGFPSSPPANKQKKRGNRRLPQDIALESRLGRNLLLCHYHDIVAPLLLSRSSPRFSNQPKGSGPSDDQENSDIELSQSIDFDSNVDPDAVHPLDWTYHWRLSLLTFAVSLVFLFLSKKSFISCSEPAFPSFPTTPHQCEICLQWLSSLAGMEESKSISTSTGHLILLAGKAGSLDKAMLGLQSDKKAASDVLAVLSHFFALSSLREKDR